MVRDLLLRLQCTTERGRGAFEDLFVSLPLYVLSAKYMKACKDFKQQVDLCGCPEELRPEYLRQLTENEKVGMVCVTKKVFDGLSSEIKQPYLACKNKVGLSGSPEHYNLLATQGLLQHLRETNKTFIVNFVDAHTGLVLGATGYPLGALVLGPQGCAREGLELAMEYEWQGGEEGGLMVSWVQAEVPKIGDGGGREFRQCLSMIMGVGLYGLTVSNPLLASEPKKLSMTLYYRDIGVVNGENASHGYMWDIVDGRLRMGKALNNASDAAAWRVTLKEEGLLRARARLLEEGARTEALSRLKGGG